MCATTQPRQSSCLASARSRNSRTTAWGPSLDLLTGGHSRAVNRNASVPNRSPERPVGEQRARSDDPTRSPRPVVGREAAARRLGLKIPVQTRRSELLPGRSYAVHLRPNDLRCVQETSSARSSAARPPVAAVQASATTRRSRTTWAHARKWGQVLRHEERRAAQWSGRPGSSRDMTP
jgi:hypothetical protein